MTAPSTTPYQNRDLRVLLALTELLGRLYTLEPSMQLLAANTGLSLPEMRENYTEYIVRQRVAAHRCSYKTLAANLGLSKSNLYRLLDTYNLPKRFTE